MASWLVNKFTQPLYREEERKPSNSMFSGMIGSAEVERRGDVTTINSPSVTIEITPKAVYADLHTEGHYSQIFNHSGFMTVKEVDGTLIDIADLRDGQTAWIHVRGPDQLYQYGAELHTPAGKKPYMSRYSYTPETGDMI